MRHKLLSWNVNGIRAAERKGFVEWAESTDARIICVQETKASKDQLSQHLIDIKGYHSIWASAERKGYSGVAVYAKEKPIKTDIGLGDPSYEGEGRAIVAEFSKYILYNIYFPNGKMNDDRLKYKLGFYEVFLGHVTKKMKQGKPVIVCGDVNTAHKEIDLARPKANRFMSGFLAEECAWLDKFVDAGLVDTLRDFHPEPELYTWWSMQQRARGRNVGWRIDYFYLSKKHRAILKDAYILSDVMGSDHCPIGIEIEVA